MPSPSPWNTPSTWRSRRSISHAKMFACSVRAVAPNIALTSRAALIAMSRWSHRLRQDPQRADPAPVSPCGQETIRSRSVWRWQPCGTQTFRVNNSLPMTNGTGSPEFTGRSTRFGFAPRMLPGPTKRFARPSRSIEPRKPRCSFRRSSTSLASFPSFASSTSLSLSPL